MDPKSRCEPTSNDSIWFSNLQLLGYDDQASPVPLSPFLFDYSNPSAFQYVFYFLLSLLNHEKTKVEFRDCWPILDKKQEAEFRRKVVNTVKEYQKDFPMDLPYTNPSLFQSPGGRKFVAFLHVFSSYVVKSFLQKHEDGLLSKPSVKNGKLKKIVYTGLVKSTKGLLEDACKHQSAINGLVHQTKESIQGISKKYFDIKTSLDDERNSNSQFPQQSDVEIEELLLSYDSKCAKVKEFQDLMMHNSAVHENLWFNIMSVVDDFMPKPRLNFKQLPSQLVVSENITMTYINMITKVLSTADRVLQFKPQSLPIQYMARGAATFTSQATQLTDVKADLGMSIGKMMENIQVMLYTSSQIDWANCELALPSTSPTQPSVQTVLLPPTPSLLEDMKNCPPNTSSIPSQLQFLSPSPTTPHPNLALPSGSLGCSPISTGQVTRRFPRRVAVDMSPLLRQSLIQSTLIRAGGGVEDKIQDTVKTTEDDLHQESKESIGLFSPVMNSTKSSQEISSRPSSRQGFGLGETRPGSALSLETEPPCFGSSQSFGSLRASAEASHDLDFTQSKLEMYRKVLLSIKNKETSQPEPDKPSLLSVWNTHRQSLSPQCRPAALSSSSSESCTSPPSPPMHFSPMLACKTPDMQHRLSISSPCSQEMASKLASRLDELMTSLTLSDNSLDFSLGRMSMGGDALLSPHCS